MIVKNEEAHLPQCLDPIAGLVNEIIVVDTGSTDQTRQVALAKGARVYDFTWQDSFAAARNESLRHATGEWIFCVDADDRVDQENQENLRALFASLPAEKNLVYLMKCLIVPAEGSSDTSRVVDQPRLFRNDPQIRWSYRVHEQILPSIAAQGGELRRANVTIQHIGYQDPALRRAKLERNLRLLQFDDAESPNDPFTLYNLGRAMERLGKLPEAVPYWRRSLSYAAPHETYIPKIYTLLIEAYSQAGRRAEMTQMCLAGMMRCPAHPELLFRAGSLLQELGDIAAAAVCLERLLGLPADGHFFLGDDTGIPYKARTLLGRIYRQQNRLVEAEAEWKTALEEEPNFVPALLGLGQLFLDQKRWDDLQTLVSHMESKGAGLMEAALLCGLRHLARKETDLARELMEETIQIYPNAIEPRIVLSRIFLDAPRDLAAAERVLREVLKLDPNNVEARRNLTRLLPIQGCHPERSAAQSRDTVGSP